MFYYKIHTNGHIEEIEIDRRMELKDFYREIECDCISYVRCIDCDTEMIIDDEGKLKDREVNFVATLLYGALPYDCINGTALLCTSEVVNDIGEMDFTGFKERKLDYIHGLITEAISPFV